jgi:iron complex transport system permease protein
VTRTERHEGALHGIAAAAVVRRVRRRGEGRVLAVSLVLAAVCFLVFCVSLSLGDVDIPLGEVVRTLFGAGDSGTGYIITELRLPRAVLGILAGAALGLSGAIFQTLLRNPLASPDFIGVTAGASAAAVLALLVFGLRGYPVSVAAFVGALATAMTIYVLSWQRGVTGYRLVLVGVAMTAMMTSVVSYGLTTAEIYDARDALVWLTGSLNAKSWATVTNLGVNLAVLFPLTLLSGRWLTALQVGDDTARGLGVPVERGRLALLAVATGLAATATAAVGPVVFVAFVSGPIARRLAGEGGLALVPAALVGALVMTASDVVAQHAIPSVQFPVGVVTAVVGTPYLLWLLAINNRTERQS